MKESHIVMRYDALKSERSTVENAWKVIEKFVMPYRSNFFEDIAGETSVDWRDNRDIFDSTAINASNTLAASIHGSLTSPAIRWFELSYKLKDLNTDSDAKIWLEDASKRCFKALQESNFNLEANEMYLDLVGFGNGPIIEEHSEDKSGDFKELVFQSCPIEDFYFEPGADGRPFRMYRTYDWDVVQLVDKFGIDGVTEKIREIFESEKVDMTKHKVIMCIYVRPDKEHNENSPKKLAAEERPYGLKYVLHRDKELLGKEGGYYEMPAFIPRWRKTASSQWGHGPAMVALPDILTLNELCELVLMAAGKVIDPAVLVTQRGLLSDVDLGRGGQTVVKDVDKDVKPLESNARFDVSQLIKGDLQRDIRSIFFIDQLEMKESPAMTATEVQVRYELMQRLLGPTLGRLQHDFLEPLVQRTFNILYRAGEFGTVPKSVVEAEGGGIDIVYSGPLVRAQRADIAAGVMRWVATASELSAVEQKVLDKIDWDKVIDTLAELEGVPAELLATADALKKIRDDREAKEEEMRKAMVAEQEGRAMKEQSAAQNEANIDGAV